MIRARQVMFSKVPDDIPFHHLRLWLFTSPSSACSAPVAQQLRMDPSPLPGWAELSQLEYRLVMPHVQIVFELVVGTPEQTWSRTIV